MLYTYDTLTLMLGMMGLGMAIYLAFRLLDVSEMRRPAAFVTIGGALIICVRRLWRRAA